MANTSAPLSFTEFKKHSYDGFAMFFYPAQYCDPADYEMNRTFERLREREVYTRSIEHSPEFKVIAEDLLARPDICSSDYLATLYRAYALMRPFAQSDDELLLQPIPVAL